MHVHHFNICGVHSFVLVPVFIEYSVKDGVHFFKLDLVELILILLILHFKLVTFSKQNSWQSDDIHQYSNQYDKRTCYDAKYGVHVSLNACYILRDVHYVNLVYYDF